MRRTCVVAGVDSGVDRLGTGCWRARRAVVGLLMMSKSASTHAGLRLSMDTVSVRPRISNVKNLSARANISNDPSYGHCSGDR